jgi:hypothetical protein
MSAEADQFELSPEERTHAQQVIDATRPGRYTLRQMFGKPWLVFSDGERRNYGGRFLQSVRKRQLLRISEDGKKSNSIVYAVHR